MTKEQYIQQLRNHMSYYLRFDTNIIDEYAMNIDEMLDEGLTMAEIIERLGTPNQLAHEIAKEFDLELKKKVGMPVWVKVILWICALPILLPFAMAFFMLILSFILVLITLTIAGISTAIACWFSGDYTIPFKIVYTFAGIGMSVSFGIISYFAVTGIWKMCHNFYLRKRVR